MKMVRALVVTFLLYFVYLLTCVSAESTGTYTTKYDKIDVDRIIHSKRLLLNYVSCLLDKGPCSPDGRDLKMYLPEALATSCAKCSEAQKKQSGKVFSYLLLNYPKEWNELVAKYDTDGTYRKKYQIDEENEDYSDLDEAR